MTTDTLPTTLETAITAFNSGEYPQAKTLCQQVLQQAPQRPEALHLLGLLEATHGNLSTAVDLLKQAIAIQPTPLFYRNLANLLTQHQQWTETLANYQQWGQQHPNDYEAWWNMATLAYQMGQLATSAYAWQHLLQRHPNSPEIYNNLANVQCEQGELLAAHHNYQQALNLNPDFAIGWYNLGRICQQQGDFTQAWNCYQEALQRNPHFAEAHNELGLWYHRQQQPEQAINSYQVALAVKPQWFDALNNLGLAHQALKQWKEAEQAFQEALAVNPHSEIAQVNLGNLLLSLGDVQIARGYFQKALENQPQLAAAHIGLGNACVALAQITDGLHHYNQALIYHPHDPDAHFNRAFAHLALGHYPEGFADYEWRLKRPEFPSRAFPQPQWTGEPSACRLLLHAEQGLGDTLQMLRFIPLVAARAPHLVLECQQSLCSLVSLFPGVKQVIPQGKLLPDFDIHLPLLSLPYVLGITLENLHQHAPVLGFPPKKPTPPTSRFTVGIAWAGNPDHLMDRHRSCSLADFAPLFDLENISFVSFQMGSAAEALKTTSFPVTDLSPHIQDFSDTATLLQDVALVISVDTALAHLAGTLGKPVWVLLSFTPDWRWLLEREDSPWYPTIRLFRQKQAGDWASVFQGVKTALSQEWMERQPKGKP